MTPEDRLDDFSDPREYQRDACGVGFVASIVGNRTHKIVTDGLTMLSNLDHRGGRARDNLSSDGAGITTAIPDKLLRSEVPGLPANGYYALGQVFLPKEESLKNEAKETISSLCLAKDFEVTYWRKMPTDPSCLGGVSAATEPDCWQAIIVPSANKPRKQWSWDLFILRKTIEVHFRKSLGKAQKQVYFSSLSFETVIYKGLILSDKLSVYYKDLSDARFESHFALVHQRFSTNTLPSWPLAQPFRIIGHNGEINTLRGNLSSVNAMQVEMQEAGHIPSMEEIGPITTPFTSDSSCLDNMLEFLLVKGRSIEQALTMLIPEPWENNDQLSKSVTDYYRYSSCLSEPWDGPAFVGFATGDKIGACLDRNGLRPGRYLVTEDQTVIMGSEAGLLAIPNNQIIEKGRLQPGRFFIVDFEQKRILNDKQIKEDLAKELPFDRWLKKGMTHLAEIPIPRQVEHIIDEGEIKTKINLHAYTKEDIELLVAPMCNAGSEPIGSMGNDTPLAILSRKSPLLFNYFKQLFAQVTNPPIDAIREKLVTSLRGYLGKKGSPIHDSADNCQAIELRQPILSNFDIARLKNAENYGQKTFTVEMSYNPESESLASALDKLCARAKAAVDESASILILSDKYLANGHIPIPSLLATSTLHHELIQLGLRNKCSIVIESGEPREVHHFCLLMGYGASAVNPYLVFDLLRSEAFSYAFDSQLEFASKQDNYIKAVGNGMLKVMSKMGISTLQSYRGSQIFEAVGLSQELVDRYFCWTPTRMGGLDIDGLEAEHKERIRTFRDRNLLASMGDYYWRVNGEKHLHNPAMITGMQKAARLNSREEFKKFCESVDKGNRENLSLRGLLAFKNSGESVKINDVESVTDILKRFSTGAMSFGSISKEAHESIALAMNQLGGKSNSGEGGENESRFKLESDGSSKRSATKQIASGRFGVTINYLANADELQIKIAQGAKPGEGGQLPGHKVDKAIAAVRHSTPGVTLISPPPHHDIYSIEDLAQLIHDLKSSNPTARVSVKLVSATGVGTIAAGVAKAKADVILISGYEGGTGASPLSSIKHAGLPWELGLAETHNSLVEAGLRSRVVLQTDGQLRTARDIVVATMLGAEEWCIGTGALVVLGCIMMRKCHLNTCPVGIATQNPELRKRFQGQPQHLINYFILLAEEIREILAQLGVSDIKSLVGRKDLLYRLECDHWKSKLLDLSSLTTLPNNPYQEPLLKTNDQDHELQQRLDNRFLLKHLSIPIRQELDFALSCQITNRDRSVGTLVSSTIAKQYGSKGLSKSRICLDFTGAAGQSFMAYGITGLKARVVGEVNDYCGKGLSGAEIVVVPPKGSRFETERSVICGNTTLYGATSGSLFVSGLAGERFAVRNSGATAVVEGVGDHGCEYMTGGEVLVLGSTGRNFAAGMSGGVAYIFDEWGQFSKQINAEMVDLEALVDTSDMRRVKSLIEEHLKKTKSKKAQRILDDWTSYSQRFVRVMPRAYREALGLAPMKQKYQSRSVKSPLIDGLSIEKTLLPQEEVYG